MTDTLLCKKIIGSMAVSEQGLHQIFKVALRIQLPKKKIILKQGDFCNHIFFVEKGCLRVFITKNFEEINTDFVFENTFTTNLKSLRLSVPSDTTIQAEEKATIYQFDKNELLSLYDDYSEIESFGRKILEELLIQQDEHINLFKLFSPAERYHYLQNCKPQLLQRVSLSKIASYIGVTRETLSRIRKIR